MHRSLPALLLSLAASQANATTLRYHGELLDGGAPANGRYDLRLTPYVDASSQAALATAVVFEDVLVEDGFFLLEPEFAATIAGDREVWIELGVRDADSTLAFATLEGRQKAVLAPLVGQCWSTTGDSGVNPSINFLGTTDGAPLVLRSTDGVGINTSSPDSMLSLRGTDDFFSGPIVTLAGTTADQVESGRIRFVEGTAAGNYRGAYIRFDGSNNMFAIGAHNNSDSLPTSDVDQIVMLRSATTRVGIGKAPAEELDVDGDVQINGGVKYSQLLNHTRTIIGSSFHEVGSDDCIADGAGGIRRSGVFNDCFATIELGLPRGARVVRLEGQFNDEDAGVNCNFGLDRFKQTSGGNVRTDLASVTSSGSGGQQTRTATLDAIVSSGESLVVTFLSRSGDCRGNSVTVSYQLPNGFIP